LEIMACIIRIIFLVDPLAYYSIFTIHVRADLVSLSTPFSLCGVLLIAIYWGNILDNVGGYRRASRWLQDRLKVYLIAAGSVFVIMLALIFYDLSSPAQGVAALAVLVIMAIIFVLVALYFIINGFRVYKAMTVTNKKNDTAKLITRYVGSLGGSLLCVVVALIILSSVRENNGAVFGNNWNLYLWLFIVSLVVVLTFQPPVSTSSASNTPQDQDMTTVKSTSTGQSGSDSAPNTPKISHKKKSHKHKKEKKNEAKEEDEEHSTETAETDTVETETVETVETETVEV